MVRYRFAREREGEGDVERGGWQRGITNQLTDHLKLPSIIRCYGMDFDVWAGDNPNPFSNNIRAKIPDTDGLKLVVTCDLFAGSLINHSSYANVFDSGIASRDIQEGEELLVDYKIFGGGEDNYWELLMKAD